MPPDEALVPVDGLRVPRLRASQCLRWIVNQSPQVVADVLEMAGAVHSAVQRRGAQATDGREAQILDEHETEKERMRELFRAQREALNVSIHYCYSTLSK